MIVVERPLHGARDIGTAAASPDPPIELAQHFVVEGYVHSHGHNLTH